MKVTVYVNNWVLGILGILFWAGAILAIVFWETFIPRLISSRLWSYDVCPYD